MMQLIDDINYAIKFYPGLKKLESNEKLKVVGDLKLHHPEIGEFDKYTVTICFPESYPKCFPKVIEESKKIPRTADRHVNSDHTLCLAVEPEERLICKNGITFKYFLDRVLIPHLGRETYRSLSGKYEDGEYKHGLEGLWDFFSQKLNITDKKSIVEELEIMLQGNWPGRNEPCFCRSKIKFKKCHLRTWEELMVLGNDYLQSRLAILKNDLAS